MTVPIFLFQSGPASGGLCHFVRLLRAEPFDLGCNIAGARQQEDVQAHARRR